MFGLPGKVLHNPGKEFDNNLFQHLAQFCNSKRIRTSPYHPQTNGHTVRKLTMNKELIHHMLTNWKNRRWKFQIKLQINFQYKESQRMLRK